MKTLDGLMRYIARRRTPEQYQAFIQRAAMHGLGLRDYVGRRVLKMVGEKYATRKKPEPPPVPPPSRITVAVLAHVAETDEETTLYGYPPAPRPQ